MSEIGGGERWEGREDEPKHALEKVKNGEFVAVYFGGQTHLFIPKKFFLKLGGTAEAVLKLAEQVYGPTVLDEFGSSTYKHANSFFIELPSQQDWKHQFEPTGKVAELIELIKGQVV